MPSRIVGGASIILGICVVVLGLNQMGMAKEIAAAMMSDGHAWNLPVSQEVFLGRARIWGEVVIIAGGLTVAGGLGMAFRRRWGLYVAVAAALVVLMFPLMSRIFLAKAYAFDWSLVDLGIAAVIGLCASVAWIFRPTRGWRREESYVRIQLLLLALFAVGIVGSANIPASDSSPMLEVYVDHYELSGVTYKTAADLKPALRGLTDKKLLTLHWYSLANETAKKEAIAVKVEEASQVAKDAGIARVIVISNEVF